MTAPEILVVEDNDGVRRLMEVLLKHYGFNACLAASGIEAVELFRLLHDSIRLVLLDVQMSPLDGPQTLAALRGIEPQVHAVFMSGDTGKYTSQELLNLGAAHVIEKPFANLALLMDSLRNLAAPERP